MSKQFPRFLFSNPQNTKSEGPFVISTFHPIIICQVYKSNNPEFEPALMPKYRNVYARFLDVLDTNLPYTSEDIQSSAYAIAKWVYFQVESGFIKL
jgi:hypothetical protein